MANDSSDPLAATAQDITSSEFEPTYNYNRLIRDAEVAALLGCSKATFWRRIADGTLPPPIKIGGMSRWWLSEIIERIERLRTDQLRDHDLAKPFRTKGG